MSGHGIVRLVLAFSILGAVVASARPATEAAQDARASSVAVRVAADWSGLWLSVGDADEERIALTCDGPGDGPGCGISVFSAPRVGRSPLSGPAVIFRESVDGGPGRRIVAEWELSFARVLAVGRREGDMLVVEFMTLFTDGSGRQPYVRTVAYRRAS